MIVGASVAAKWYLPDEENLKQANELLDQFDQDNIVLVAPDLIWAEVASAIVAATIGRNARLSTESGELAIAELLTLDLEIYGSRDLLLPAYELVGQLSCAIYDAVYLALSDYLAVPFITADRKLYQRIQHLPDVLWLGDYPTSP